MPAAVHHAGYIVRALAWAFRLLVRGRLRYNTFLTVQVFWFFVVGVWPILYMQVYL